MGDGFHTFLGWIPWNGGWIPWNGGWIPSFFYLVQMDSRLFPYGIHMESTWNPHGICSWHHNYTLIPHYFKGELISYNNNFTLKIDCCLH